MVETIALGDRTVDLVALPWGRLKKLTTAIGRVGLALTSGAVLTDAALEDMTEVLSIGFGIPRAELDEMPITYEQAAEAFLALMKVSGMQEVADRHLGEARRLAASQAMTSTPGTGSTPT